MRDAGRWTWNNGMCNRIQWWCESIALSQDTINQRWKLHWKLWSGCCSTGMITGEHRPFCSNQAALLCFQEERKERVKWEEVCSHRRSSTWSRLFSFSQSIGPRVSTGGLQEESIHTHTLLFSWNWLFCSDLLLLFGFFHFLVFPILHSKFQENSRRQDKTWIDSSQQCARYFTSVPLQANEGSHQNTYIAWWYT